MNKEAHKEANSVFIEECCNYARANGETIYDYMVIGYNDEGEADFCGYLKDKEECAEYLDDIKDNLTEGEMELYDVSSGEPIIIPFITKRHIQIEKLKSVGFEVVDEEKLIVKHPNWPLLTFELGDKDESVWMHHIIEGAFNYGKNS